MTPSTAQNLNNKPQRDQEVQPQQIIEQLPAHLSTFLSQEIWNTLTYEQKDVLNNLEKLPSQLNGVVPDSVWGTLSSEQKLEFLFSHNLLPRNEQIQANISANQMIEDGFDGQMAEQINNQDLSAGTSNVSKAEESQQTVENIVEQQQFTDAVHTVESNEEEYNESSKQQESLTNEESARVDQENGISFNVPTMKFVGYTPSDSTVANSSALTQGSTDKGTTWIATAIEKAKLAIGLSV